MRARVETSGKISFDLKEEELSALQIAVRSALYADGSDMELYLYSLLVETLEELSGHGEISLSRSKFYVLFSPIVLKRLEEPIRAAMLLEGCIAAPLQVKRSASGSLQA